MYLWICVFYSTHFLRNTPFWEENILYRPSKFFRPFWQSMPKGEKSLEGFVLFEEVQALVLFLSICLLVHAYLLCMISIIHHINPLNVFVINYQNGGD